MTQGSYDILWAIKKICDHLLLSMYHQHVKGHQEKTGRPLTQLETLNCIVDERAGQYCGYIKASTSYEYSQLHWITN